MYTLLCYCYCLIIRFRAATTGIETNTEATASTNVLTKIVTAKIPTKKSIARSMLWNPKAMNNVVNVAPEWMRDATNAVVPTLIESLSNILLKILYKGEIDNPKIILGTKATSGLTNNKSTGVAARVTATYQEANPKAMDKNSPDRPPNRIAPMITGILIIWIAAGPICINPSIGTNDRTTIIAANNAL